MARSSPSGRPMLVVAITSRSRFCVRSCNDHPQILLVPPFTPPSVLYSSIHVRFNHVPPRLSSIQPQVAGCVVLQHLHLPHSEPMCARCDGVSSGRQTAAKGSSARGQDSSVHLMPGFYAEGKGARLSQMIYSFSGSISGSESAGG